MSTAHPCKFPKAIEDAISKTENLPDSLKYVNDRKEKFEVLSNDIEKVKKICNEFDMKLKIKDQLPDTEVFQLIDGEPQKSKLRETIGNGKVVLFGLPGAFTSTCSKLHLPGFVANADKIKAKGIENIFCLSVNDPYVMNAWGELIIMQEIKLKCYLIHIYYLRKAIGAEVDRNTKGMGIRSNRYLMIVENFTVVNVYVEKETKECGLTSAENLLNNLI